MPTNPKISTAARNAACDAVVDLVDGGPAAGYIEIRDGAIPANPAAADSGNLLATLTFSDPAFGAAATGVASANSITGDPSVVGGTGTYFRVKDSTGTVIFQGTSGETDEDLIWNESTFVSTGTADITSFTVTMPEQ